MNCQAFQKLSDLHHNENISSDIRAQVEDHLDWCKECADYYKIESLTFQIINQEKEISSNPFLVTRIMASIEKLDSHGYKAITLIDSLIRPVILTGALTIAVFVGVMVGNIHRPIDYTNTIPLEFALIDDVAMESVDILLSE